MAGGKGSRRRWAELKWFIRRPRLYRELLRRAARKLSGGSRRERSVHRSSAARAQAQDWCERHAVDTPTALGELTGRSPPQPFAERFDERLREARAAAGRCTQRMGGPGNLDLIYGLAEHLQAKRVVETGVAYGWSALACLSSLERRAEARLVSTDLPYVRRETDDCVGVVVPAPLRDCWTLIRHPDRDALPRALAAFEELDMCHYDSDKTYDGRTWAYRELWNALRPGGVFISDDIADNLAFHDFCRELGERPVIVAMPADPGVQYAGVLVKQ